MAYSWKFYIGLLFALLVDAVEGDMDGDRVEGVAGSGVSGLACAFGVEGTLVLLGFLNGDPELGLLKYQNKSIQWESPHTVAMPLFSSEYPRLCVHWPKKLERDRITDSRNLQVRKVNVAPSFYNSNQRCCDSFNCLWGVCSCFSDQGLGYVERDSTTGGEDYDQGRWVTIECRN